ncbi:MAG: hypothetical protein CME70_06805 [Halobacteriovorax sp.]|nr:hypothetical protein [Halobacteriovorax sp.]|tara:strand:- start:490420 stop:490824 length:405 start_codon:yes stop_codon:yes gene_type:complete
MKTRPAIQFLILGLFMLTATMSFARDYMIYSIVQEIPMGEPNEKIKKNFYINMGKQQGVDRGTTLDVYRTVHRVDPYATKKRYNYKIKVGQLKVVHSEENAAIGAMETVQNEADDALLEIENLMIGDEVSVHIN